MLLWAHGLEGSPVGYKVTELRRRGFDLLAPDCLQLPLAQRVATYLRLTEGRADVVLAGSSYGGLASAYLAHTVPERLRALLLLAPALHHSEEPVAHPSELRVPASVPCTVVHGTRDSIVPIEVSRALAARCPHITLIEVDDTHGLSGSLPTIAAALAKLCADTE